MDYLDKKFDQLTKALYAWGSVLEKPVTDELRDASIKRFEFTFELLWKNLRIYLRDVEGIDASSPKSCFRKARSPLKLTDEEVELCLDMTDQRNIAVHTYSEEMSNDLYKKLKDYISLSKVIYNKLKNNRI